MLIAIGAAFCVLPGPGLPLSCSGLALVAARSQRFAKLIDRAECRLRAAWRAIHPRWRVLPKPAKGSVMLGIASLVAAVGIFTWHFVISKYLLRLMNALVVWLALASVHGQRSRIEVDGEVSAKAKKQVVALVQAIVDDVERRFTTRRNSPIMR